MSKLIGAYRNMPAEEYHKIEAFSFTGAKSMKKSPRHYLAYRNKEYKTNSKNEQYKTVHLALLEPEKRKEMLYIAPFNDFKKKEAREVRDMALAEGKIVVTQKVWDESVVPAANSAKIHELVGPMLKNSESEVSIFWDCPDTGAYCKARLDLLNLEMSAIGDIKNFSELDELNEIEWQIYRMKYYWQMAHYREGAEITFKRKFDISALIFIEDKEPFSFRVCCPVQASHELAKQELFPLKQLYNKCTKTNNWPGWEEKAIDVGLPDKAWRLESEEWNQKI